MILSNNTTLRGYLAHIQSLARQAATLRGAAAIHPDDTPELAAARAPNPVMLEMWESLRRDLAKVLDVHLVPYSELALVRFPTGDRDDGWQGGGKDELRVTFRVLKKRADKARLRDPSITLLGSWKLEEHEPPEDDNG